jgi:predicted protein tyrosine phosphatase
VSFRAEVITNREGDWVSNRCRFATIEEASDYVTDLWRRWRMVTDTRVIPCDDPVNYRYINGELLAILTPVTIE